MRLRLDAMPLTARKGPRAYGGLDYFYPGDIMVLYPGKIPLGQDSQGAAGFHAYQT